MEMGFSKKKATVIFIVIIFLILFKQQALLAYQWDQEKALNYILTNIK